MKMCGEGEMPDRREKRQDMMKLERDRLHDEEELVDPSRNVPAEEDAAARPSSGKETDLPAGLLPCRSSSPLPPRPPLPCSLLPHREHPPSPSHAQACRRGPRRTRPRLTRFGRVQGSLTVPCSRHSRSRTRRARRGPCWLRLGRARPLHAPAAPAPGARLRLPRPAARLLASISRTRTCS